MQNLITIEQLAELLEVDRSFVYRLNYEGRGPTPIRLGARTVRYRLSDVERWLAERTKAHADESWG